MDLLFVRTKIPHKREAAVTQVAPDVTLTMLSRHEDSVLSFHVSYQQVPKRKSVVALFTAVPLFHILYFSHLSRWGRRMTFCEVSVELFHVVVVTLAHVTDDVD